MITFDLEVVFMESIFIATGGDVKRWVREALEGYFSEQTLSVSRREVLGAESILNRQQVARILDISTVTLHAWMKRGLPNHKQGGRVYFLR